MTKNQRKTGIFKEKTVVFSFCSDIIDIVYDL